MEFAVLPKPVTPIIIGNMRHVTEDFEEKDKKIKKNFSQVQTKSTNNQANVQHETTFENKINKCSEKQNKKNKFETDEQTIENGNKKHCEPSVSNKVESNLLVVKHLNKMPSLSNSSQVDNDVRIRSSDFTSESVVHTALPCTNKSDELTAVIEYKDENYIPINAVLTRNKARQLADIKAPDFSLQILDISPEKFKEMQQSDKSLD